jgi:hypothetical protein
MLRIFIIVILFQITNLSNASTDLIFTSRVATTLSGVNIYPDSTFEIQSNGSFKVGELVEVIGETEMEHEDASQNQKFKWFKVRSLKGKEGWVFGDGIAVVIPDSKIELKLKEFHKKKYHFNNGFEKSVIWIAGIEGRDNFHGKDFLNPPYREYYIVITNEQGNCVFVNYSGDNTRGQMQLRHILLSDTTGDEIPELLLQTSSFSTDVSFENRIFEIYSFQSGDLSRIFEERMSLSYSANVFAPSLFKYIEVDNEIVRVAYVDYIPCTDYKQQNDFGNYNKQKERCMEYVTYTYGWNERTKQYRMIYEESHTTPVVRSKKDLVVVKDEPSIIGKRVTTANQSDRIEVIKQHARTVLENGVKKTDLYFYVKLKDGTNGYIEADGVGFIDIEHAELLNYYYKSSSPDMSDWKKNKHFLHIVGDNRSSYSGIKKRE